MGPSYMMASVDDTWLDCITMAYESIKLEDEKT